MIKVSCLVVATLLAANIDPGIIKPLDPGVDWSFSFLSEETSSSLSPQNQNYFYCSTYGPFEVGDPDIATTFQYQLDIPNQEIIERIRLFDSDNSVLYAASKTSRSYTNMAYASVSFTIPLHDYLTNSGLTIKFEILNKSTRAILSTYSATIYPVSQPSVSYISLKQDVYQTKNIGFYWDGETMQGITEKYDFRSISDYFDVDYYYRMDLKDIFFKYESMFQLQYNSINLRFEDRDNLFPFFNHDASKNIVIPLKIETNGTRVNLKFNKTFYINKRTLQISDTYRTGFVTTQYFYLPVNGKKRFNNKTIYLDINGLGKSQLTTSFPIRYLVDKSLVGASNDGVHHVGGGSR